MITAVAKMLDRGMEGSSVKAYETSALEVLITFKYWVAHEQCISDRSRTAR